MSFDWFTFVAQIVNFLVLVALLKRFLYGPIMTAMQQREEELAASRSEVAEHRQQAEAQTAAYRAKLEELEARKQALLDDVKQEVDKLRKEWLIDARETVERRRNDWMQTIDREKEALSRQLRWRACKEVVGTARRALQELSGADLEERIIDRFLQRLDECDPQTRHEIRDALQRHSEPVSIRTSFDMSPEQQQRVRISLSQSLDTDRSIAFHTSNDVVCGIEVQVDGIKLAWSIDEFLSSVEEELEREVV